MYGSFPVDLSVLLPTWDCDLVPLYMLDEPVRIDPDHR